MNSKYELFLNNCKIHMDFINFPAGEKHVRLFNVSSFVTPTNTVTINAHVFDGDIMMIGLIKDAIERELIGKVNVFKLFIPYLPYGRQDRVAVPGESFSLKVFCNFINGLNFDQVEIADYHSTVSPSLLNNVVCRTYTAELLLERDDGIATFIRKNFKNMVYISPDLGAVKRTCKFAGLGDEADILIGLKNRDPKTGYITNYNLIKGANVTVTSSSQFLVVDDICDGEATFEILADSLKQQYPGVGVSMIVTHGIFSKGKEKLQSKYDNVFAIFDYPEITK